MEGSLSSSSTASLHSLRQRKYAVTRHCGTLMCVLATTAHHTLVVTQPPHHTRTVTPPHQTTPHITPHHSTLHHITPHYTTSHHTTLHHTIPHHTTSHHTTPHYTTLYHNTSHHTTLHHTKLCRITPSHHHMNTITSHCTITPDRDSERQRNRQTHIPLINITTACRSLPLLLLLVHLPPRLPQFKVVDNVILVVDAVVWVQLSVLFLSHVILERLAVWKHLLAIQTFEAAYTTDQTMHTASCAV